MQLADETKLRDSQDKSEFVKEALGDLEGNRNRMKLYSAEQKVTFLGLT